ncbi:tRNA 4-thiouridine(8) synthase ThiI [soil metagenome]
MEPDFLHTKAPEAVEVLRRVPGISSLSPIEAQCRAELEEIVRVGRETFGERVRGHSFAVRAKRSGNHPFTSEVVQRELGAALNPGARVDLQQPEVTVHVEVRDRRAYLFSEWIDAMGGLPLGVDGYAVCLLSGEFDSTVAASLMLKRGVELDYVFCNLAGDAYERSVVRVAKVLADGWSYGTRPRLHVVDFAAALDALRAHTRPKYWQLVLKRLMYRAAAQVAAEQHASALVTGEAVGQVSSQTLANLRAIDGAVDLPVLRPLIGFDKDEIIAFTRRIGSYELSSRVREYCAIAPGNPATRATRAATAREEEMIDPAIIRQAVAERCVLDLRSLGTADLVQPYIFAEEIPEEAVVLDIRAPHEWEEWHHPGALNLPMAELLSRPLPLNRRRSYVLYCAQGPQAAHLAEQLQREGYEAYAFRGGFARCGRYRSVRLEMCRRRTPPDDRCGSFVAAAAPPRVSGNSGYGLLRQGAFPSLSSASSGTTSSVGSGRGQALCRAIPSQPHERHQRTPAMRLK